MTAKKDTHENWGGPRKAGEGRKMGRPSREGGNMQRVNIRIPPEWIDALTEHGDGKLATGIRRIIEESGVVG